MSDLVSGFSVSVLSIEGSQEERTILEELKAFNQAQAGDSKSAPLVISLKDGQNRVIAGLTGKTNWNWLFISLLWIRDDQRGSGLGSKLLLLAEAEAVRRGCNHVYLDTFSFQAPGFYERMGYVRFGVLNDFPPGHQRHFFRKDL